MINSEEQQFKEKTLGESPPRRTYYNQCTGKGQYDLELIRKNLIRLLASSKRTAHTRQCLKKRFSAEKRWLLKQSKNYISGKIYYPKDASDECEEDKKWVIDEVAIEPTPTVVENLYNVFQEDNKRLCETSTRFVSKSMHHPPKYNNRRFSLTVIEDEEASSVQKNNFQW